MTQNGVIVILNRTFFEAGAGKMCGCSSTMAQPIPPTKSSIQHESAVVVAAPEGEHVTFQIEALGPKIVTMEVFSNVPAVARLALSAPSRHRRPSQGRGVWSQRAR